MFWYWFFVAPALLLAILSLRGERKRAAYVESRLSETAEQFPPASVIVPVKGEDQGLRENLAALASLDYPDYELLICAQKAADIPPGVLPARAKIVFARDGDPETGEKIQNLLAALHAASIGPARVSGTGLGANGELASDATPEGREQNRRVEVVFALTPTALAP